jgi:hypothetical protein
MSQVTNVAANTVDESDSASAPKARKRRLDVNPSLIISDGRSKRRKSPTPEASPGKGNDTKDNKDPKKASELGLALYRKIMDSKDAE